MKGMETEGCVFFEEKLEKKRHKVDKKDTRKHKMDKQIYTSLVQRHKVKGKVVPFGGKKGTSLIRKGTSKAKKEQAERKRLR